MLPRAKSLLNLYSDHLHALPLLVLYLTDGCNSRCVTCDIWRNPRRNMPMALVESIADVCQELGVRWVLLSGGEAMQHPEWPAIARRFRQEGIHVMLLTNGLLLRKQAQATIDSVDEVIVSLDGGNATTYELLRGVDAFDLILDGVRTLRAADVPVTTRTTVQASNFREIPQIIAVGLSHDVNLISFLPVDVSNPFAFGERDLSAAGSALSRAEVEELDELLSDVERRYAEAFASGRIAEPPAKLRRTLVQHFRAGLGDAPPVAPPCNAPHISVVIEVDGTLRPCYFLPSFGRLKPDGDRLPEAINWDVAKDLRKAYRTGQRPECAQCVCPLYKGARSLLRM